MRRWSRQTAREYVPVVVLLIGGLSTSWVMFNVLRAQELEVARYDFVEEARTYFRAFERQLQSAIDAVKWSSVSLASLPPGNPRQYAAYFRTLGEEDNKGIDLLWAPRVGSGERSEFERRAREGGLGEFSICEKGADGQWEAAKQRDEYFPIIYDAHEDSTDDYSGYDCASDASTLRYLELARDGGKMFFAPRVPYLDSGVDGANVLAIYPVYRKERESDSEASRRENLLGFVLGHMRVDVLSDVAFAKLRQQEIDLYVYDAFEGFGEKLLHFRPGVSREPGFTPLGEKEVMQYKGINQVGPVTLGQTRRWLLACMPTPVYLRSNQSWIPVVGLLASLGLTVLVAYHIVHNIRLRRQAEAMVRHRTAELNRTNQRLRGEVVERVRFEQERDGLLGLLEASNTSLQDLNARLERSNRDLQEFALVASHDLKEPLRKVQVLAGTLRQKCQRELEGVGEEYVQLIEGATHRMQCLITNLLQISRVSTHGQEFVSVDLNEILGEVVSDLAVRLSETGGRIEVGNLPRLEGDPVQLHQCLQNILDNSLKFHKDGEAPHISVESHVVPGESENGSLASTRGDRCRIVIRDNGIGFPPSDADKVFALFHRVEHKHGYDGNGVGLAVCRKIVERHGGQILAESDLLNGSVFTITLPLGHEGQRLESEAATGDPPGTKAHSNER